MRSDRPNPSHLRAGLAVAILILLGGSFVGAADRSAAEPNAVDFERIRIGLAHVGLTSIIGEQVAIRWLGSGNSPTGGTSVAGSRARR